MIESDRVEADAPSREELLAGIREAVAGVLARFDRAYFVEKARTDGSIDELWQDMAEKGLMGVGIPGHLGGLGGGVSGLATVVETMSAAGVPPILYLLTAFSREAILKHGSEQLIADHVVPTVAGERKICFGVTEPDAGTNSFAMRTRAKAIDGSRYVINGQKAFITGADEADHILIIARSAPPGEKVGRRSGFSLFIVDIETPGLERHRMNVEYHAPERQFEIFFTDMEVGSDSLVGEEGRGFEYLFDSLNAERLLVAAWACGLGTYALQRGVDYAKHRAPFGQPIGGYQAVQHPLALAKANLEAAHVMTDVAAAAYDAGGDVGPRANYAKLLASRAAGEALEATVQAHGGHAFVAESDVSTLWPMIRSFQVAPINNQSVLNYIGEHVLGLPRSFGAA